MRTKELLSNLQLELNNLDLNDIRARALEMENALILTRYNAFIVEVLNTIGELNWLNCKIYTSAFDLADGGDYLYMGSPMHIVVGKKTTSPMIEGYAEEVVAKMLDQLYAKAYDLEQPQIIMSKLAILLNTDISFAMPAVGLTSNTTRDTLFTLLDLRFDTLDRPFREIVTMANDTNYKMLVDVLKWTGIEYK